jgi:ABC-2 type transport system permease protein
LLAPRFGDYVTSVSPKVVRTGGPSRPFSAVSRQGALRRKELRLLWRDPWLVSQTLMQLLYLLPPAVMLWRSFGDGTGGFIVLAPVLVMAAGQLAGGLAWLTISGEDAADLVATAPLSASRITRAKIEVVLLIIVAVFAPLILALLLVWPELAVITAVTSIFAACSAIAIQLWFRVQGRRSQFRRRQTASRIATFAEAFSSIGWAATAALALVLPGVALVAALLTAAAIVGTWKICPAWG